MTFSNPLFAKCPSCSSSDTLRISRARNSIEKIVKALSWYELFRCKKCVAGFEHSLVKKNSPVFTINGSNSLLSLPGADKNCLKLISSCNVNN
jgi:hypothetical protein